MIKKILYLLLIIFSINLVFADINGVWHLASDIQGGTFGEDEQNPNTNFTFINKVYFEETIYSKEITAIDSSGISLKTNDGTRRLYVKDNGFIGIGKEPSYNLDINGSLNSNQYYINEQLIIDSNKFWQGKIITPNKGGTGVANCLNNQILKWNNTRWDCVNINDDNSTNELQNLNSVLNLGNSANNKQIKDLAQPTENQDAATKKYVDDKVSTSTNTVADVKMVGASTASAIGPPSLPACPSGYTLTSSGVFNAGLTGSISDKTSYSFIVIGICVKYN